MELNDKQKLTIEHLGSWQNITEDNDIIAFCLKKIPLTSKEYKNSKSHIGETEFRRHSVKHYQGIIDYILQKKKSEQKPKLRQLMEEEKDRDRD